jgi:hypothetical protein
MHGKPHGQRGMHKLLRDTCSPDHCHAGIPGASPAMPQAYGVPQQVQMTPAYAQPVPQQYMGQAPADPAAQQTHMSLHMAPPSGQAPAMDPNAPSQYPTMQPLAPMPSLTQQQQP